MIDCSESLKSAYKQSSVKKELQIEVMEKSMPYNAKYAHSNFYGIDSMNGVLSYPMFKKNSDGSLDKGTATYNGETYNFYQDELYWFSESSVNAFDNDFINYCDFISMNVEIKLPVDLSNTEFYFELCAGIKFSDLSSPLYLTDGWVSYINFPIESSSNKRVVDLHVFCNFDYYKKNFSKYGKVEKLTGWKIFYLTKPDMSPYADARLEMETPKMTFQLGTRYDLPLSTLGYGRLFTDSYSKNSFFGDAEEKAKRKAWIKAWYENLLSGSDFITNSNIVSESFELNESLCSSDNIKFGCCESSYCNFNYRGNSNLNGKNIVVKQFVNDEELKLGKFVVKETRKQYHGTEIEREVTAYDGLYKLEENAMDWYTKYMFGVSTDTFTDRFGIEYTRQIFSTYYNFAKSIGIENESNYSVTVKDTVTSFSRATEELKSKNGTSTMVIYAQKTYTNFDINKPYIIDVEPQSGYTLKGMIDSSWPSYYSDYDELGRGFATANVLITETLSNNRTNKFVVDSGDMFMLSPNCTSFRVLVAYGVNGTGRYMIIDSFSLKEVNREINLTNASTRLMYYNWSTKEIFTCDSSVTGRQVIHSILEPTGCFFKLDREGLPQFKYCTKSALYPSNTLYPANNLYPRGSDETATRGMYEYFHCEDYEVKDFGKIQIVKNTNSNESKSIVEWTYVGDSSKENTYLIDDNIFYCHADMEYEYDSMTEVSEMLSNMFERIKDMGYTPMTASCVGMPYLECGDRIVLLTENSGIESFIFSRTLKGIQALKDTYESKGDEVNAEINDFGYSEFK